MIYRDFYQHLLEHFSQPVELFTGARKQGFTMYSNQGKIYVKNSKNKESHVPRKDVNAFIAEFEETENISPSHYKKITFHASYLLVAIEYISKGNNVSIERFHSQENADSEQQYHLWLKNNPEGYVLNIPKRDEGKGSASVGDLTCLHASRCDAINNQRSYSQPQPFTGGDYFKVCGKSLETLEAEALKITQLQSIRRCSRCINQVKESQHTD